jgi:hypothetical protein
VLWKAIAQINLDFIRTFVLAMVLSFIDGAGEHRHSCWWSLKSHGSVLIDERFGTAVSRGEKTRTGQWHAV